MVFLIHTELRCTVNHTSDYGIYVPGFEFPQRQENIFFPEASRPALGPTKPPIQRSRVCFPGVKRAGPEDINLHPSSAEVENEWSFTSTLPVWQGQHWLYCTHNQRMWRKKNVSSQLQSIIHARLSQASYINWLVLIMETECVYCAVRTVSLNVIRIIGIFKLSVTFLLSLFVRFGGLSHSASLEGCNYAISIFPYV